MKNLIRAVITASTIVIATDAIADGVWRQPERYSRPYDWYYREPQYTNPPPRYEYRPYNYYDRPYAYGRPYPSERNYYYSNPRRDRFYRERNRGFRFRLDNHGFEIETDD